MRNCRMNHITALIRSVPVCRSRRTPNDISNTQLDWFPSFIANPARSGMDSEQLSILVRMPVSPCTGREHDVENRETLLSEDWVGPYIAGKGGPEF